MIKLDENYWNNFSQKMKESREANKSNIANDILNSDLADKIKDYAEQAANGFLAGQAPHIVGAVQEYGNLRNKIDNLDYKGLVKDFGKTYLKGRENTKKELNEFREENPYSSTAAEILGGIGSGGAVSSMAKSVLKKAIPRAMAEGSLYGGLYGASNTEGKGFDPMGATIGTIAGGVGGAALGTLGKLAKKILLSNRKDKVITSLTPNGVPQNIMENIVEDKNVAKAVAGGDIGKKVKDYSKLIEEKTPELLGKIQNLKSEAYKGISDDTMISLKDAIKQMDDSIANYKKLAGKDPEAQKAIKLAEDKVNIIKDEIKENFEKGFDYKSDVNENNYLDRLSEIAEKNKAHVNVKQTPQQEYAHLKDLEQINKQINIAKPSLTVADKDLINEMLLYKPENVTYNLDNIMGVRELAKNYYKNEMQGINRFMTRPEIDGKIYFTGREKFFDANNQNKEALMQLPLVKHIIKNGKLHPFSKVSPDATNKIQKGIEGYYFITDVVNMNGKNKLLGVSLEKDKFGNYFYNLNNNIVDNLQKKLGSRFYPTSQVGVQLPSTDIIPQNIKDVNKNIDFGKLKYHIDDLNTIINKFYEDLPTGGKKILRPQKEVEMFENMTKSLRQARDSHSPQLENATKFYSDMQKALEEMAKLKLLNDNAAKNVAKYGRDNMSGSFEIAEKKVKSILGKHANTKGLADDLFSAYKQEQAANALKPISSDNVFQTPIKILKNIATGGNREQKMQTFAQAVLDGKITKEMLNKEMRKGRIGVAPLINYYLALSKVPQANLASAAINKVLPKNSKQLLESVIIPRLTIRNILDRYYNKEQSK